MAAIDDHVMYHLERVDAPQTAKEIAEGSGLSVSTVNQSLRRLLESGEVRISPVVVDRARTWKAVK